MRVAVEGCSHGELDAIYDAILANERATGERVDLVLLCGDVQALRNESDLPSLAVPLKYRRLGDFHRYYSGEKTAPILTLVIGGNHEASNYLWELYYGGWLAPNIYYLGAAGCVEVGGLMVAGASGIYKVGDYTKGHYERQPYGPGDLRSVYHTRQFEIAKLRFLPRPTIFLSHDWPNGIELYGDTAALVRRKPFFRQEIETSTLGSPPLQVLLAELRPHYWFSAHLHVRFAARVDFSSVPRNAHEALTAASSGVPTVANPEALDIGDDFDEAPVAPAASTSPSGPPVVTEFLSLSKCVPRAEYLGFFTVDAPHDAILRTSIESRPTIPLHYSPRWLSITRAMHPFFSLQRNQPTLPTPEDEAFQHQLEKELASLEEAWTNQTDLLDVRSVQTFVRTAPAQHAGLHNATEPGIPNPINTDSRTTVARSYASSQHRSTSPAHGPPAQGTLAEIAQIRATAQERKRKRMPPH